MHRLSLTNKTQDSQLGPTLTAEVQVEGVSVEDFLDTGSPTTIISLDLLLPPGRSAGCKETKGADPRTVEG